MGTPCTSNIPLSHREGSEATRDDLEMPAYSDHVVVVPAAPLEGSKTPDGRAQTESDSSCLSQAELRTEYPKSPGVTVP